MLCATSTVIFKVFECLQVIMRLFRVMLLQVPAIYGRYIYTTTTTTNKMAPGYRLAYQQTRYQDQQDLHQFYPDELDCIKSITMSKATKEKMMLFSTLLLFCCRWRTDWYCTLRLCSLFSSIEIAALFSLTIFGSAYYFSKYHYLKKYQTLTLAARGFISYILVLNLMNIYIHSTTSTLRY